MISAATIDRLKQPVRRVKHLALYLLHRARPRRSYGQLQDDLVAEILVGPVKRFVDIGAYDGKSMSNTFLFALRGARGLCFEPVAQNFLYLDWTYKLDPRVICINEGISARDEVLEIRASGIMSSIPDSRSDRLDERLGALDDAAVERVRVRPLEHWLDRHPAFRAVDLVSMDVEGHEWPVLQGIDLDRFQAKLWIIETHGDRATPDQMHPHFEAIDALLGDHGYVAVLTNELNTFWLRSDLVREPVLQRVIRDFPGYRPVAPASPEGAAG